MTGPVKRTFVALGGNRGDVASTIAAALAELDDSPGIAVVRSSANYESAPMGAAASDPFLNSVAELETDWEPLHLLQHLHALEHRFGRVRDVAWGPRTIDLDLLYVGTDVVCSDPLTLPHPHAWYRRFVLAPMCEIAADFVDPVRGETQSQLLQRIDARPLVVALRECPSIDAVTLEGLRADFPQADFQIEDEGLPGVIVTESAAAPTASPLISLSGLPGSPAQGLRSVLEAMLGDCRPDCAAAHITEK